MRRYLIIAVVLLLNSCQGHVFPTYSEPADLSFNDVARPVIVFAEGHNNYSERDSFADMEEFLAKEGFDLKQHMGAITREALKGVSILHTDNALAPENQDQDNWTLPTPSAFTPEEISIIYDWVHDGGSLLMVIEHMPFGGSYEDLAKAFNVETSNGFAVDKRLLNGYSEETIDDAGWFVFRQDNGALGDHPILTGRQPHERIEFVAADVGSAFRLPERAVSLMTFGSNAISLEPSVSWRFDSTTPRRSVSGWSQGGVMKVGKGRLAVLGDNFLMIPPSQLKSEKEVVFGRYNPQFTVNVYRWLSGQL
ncbi:conserved exported protein of unknown function [uncultured Woeseiaceae bacterium]|uniref:DUF4350 domain-containing protein n=1 Tax=uncultured Woeseiaceae bacterium TaxID=1983305 RepID=A0A7D9H590_9GAMM|nr:conserved exported protein of unknown function [uncultured Woeseiaceae bacterium]